MKARQLRNIIPLLGTLLLISRSFAGEILVQFPQPLSPRIANYAIEVRLDTEQRLLQGKQLLIWYNRSADRINELQFHLYLNAFRNAHSTYMKESRGNRRRIRFAKERQGYSDVHKIELIYGDALQGDQPWLLPDEFDLLKAPRHDVTHSMQFIQPDDNNAADSTVFRISLPKHLAPGERILVLMEFTAQLPTPPFERTGAKEEFFFVAQWFPKVGVFLDGQWNTHQFHVNSEFFADFGVYNVHITVPEDFIVGATGVEVDVQSNLDGTRTHFYHAEDVHDFAWTASPEFLEFNQQVQDVTVRLLIQPDHVEQAQRHLQAAKVAIEYFQKWYGDYPFPNLTIVDPRRGARGAGGMEYPTLIASHTEYGVSQSNRALEHVIIHEFGHNYWYHLLASNEFEESWLDEGITTYTDIQIMNDAYGPVGDRLDFGEVKLNFLQMERFFYAMFPQLDPIMRKSWQYESSISYAVNSYSKPALVLSTLHNYLGREVMHKIMRSYVQRWRFKHPKSQDFFDIVNEVSGQDLTWFFQQAFYSTAILDYGVERVSSIALNAARDPETASGEKDSTNRQIADSLNRSNQPERFESEVVVRRLGEFHFPVELKAVFADGDTVRAIWDGREAWKKFRFQKSAPIVYATVDPDRKIPLDFNFSNNSWTMKSQSTSMNKLTARFMFWMQSLLDQPELVNFFTMPLGLF